ncbi:hypothetical protein CONLIGDRAFT_647656 [Coniochaeta ligniaria NRRL 30616]|uniref:Uncharacterized protein n=1 Tax=Coniochaeta ligniaria NRRL 30616 TaxID=1408157 RepID=A0A1J7IEN8_9PEZI|nr:hypothetical protein CONLIGDRAFT_647656 [Coniochaeta ligniaria NRRL 30616]
MASFRKPTTVKSLPGFEFQRGPIFSSDMEISLRVYAALIGEDISNLSLQEAIDRACHSLVKVFETALQYEDLYRALRGGHDFWRVVTGNTALYYDLAAADMKVMLVAMAKARNMYSGSAVPSYLNTLVDRFIALEDGTRLMGAPHTFTVVVSSATAAEQESEQMIGGLASNLRGMNILQSWPPSYFTTQDLIFLTDKDVAAVLGGVSTENSLTRLPLPPTNSRTLPMTLQVSLCYLALTHSEKKDWALFLTPVGFLDYNRRREWYALAGRQTKIFATVPHFLAYAADAMFQRNKNFAVGMLAHWLLRKRNLQRTTNFDDNDPADLWAGREMMRRYATVVILRRIATPVGKRLHVIWYDPWRHDGEIKRQFGHSQHAITAYRGEVAEAIKEWAVENGVEIERQYYGGPVSSGQGVAGDSVRQCLNYIETLASANSMADGLPGEYDQPEFERQGYVLTN